ncbi:shikimate kinase [Marinifilum fragile]|uniref:shikimate kinase n=1 Tax=Marinifilum fragile TaxID=570161 RepID=UPI0009F90B0E|nr:shikimate kinase [Marinifilum fragile]
MRIFLVGYMGSGKSRWGKMIANHYGLRFIDLDTHIEELEGMTIPEIFAKYKEEGFREREKSALQSIAEIDNLIIATGGGAPCYENNMQEMNSLGDTLYIEGTPELLRDRITNSKTERPLVKNFTQEELLEYIQNHLNSRKPFYEQAKYKIETGDLQLENFIQILDPIINSLNQ